MATNDALYQALFKAYTDAHPTKPMQYSQAEVAERWNEMKKEADYHTKVNALISDLKAIAMTKKGRLLAFWGNQAVPNHTTKENSDHSLSIEAPSEATNSLSSVVSTNPNELCTSGSSSRYKSTAQTDLQHQIDLINGDLVGLCRRQSSNMLSKEQETELHCKKRKKEELEKLLKKKRDDQKRAQKYRAKRKHVMLDLCEKNPEVKELLKLREKSGRPRLEEDQPLLLQAIVDIALHGAPAHERRQCEVYRSIKTLDELTAQLKKDGFQISRSGTYLRLIPRRVIPMLAERMCKKCSLYFATKVLLKEHCSIHNETQPVSRDRPIRIAARRQRELMTIISYIENGEHIDWMDELELDCDTIPVPADDTEEMDEAIPVVSTEEHLETPWECPDSSI
eukprot:Em0078g7a